MTTTPEIGAVFPAFAHPADLPAFAADVEALGYDSLWVIEDCFLSGGLTLAATALAVTQRVKVGVGLLPVAVRNPAIVAMEIATLARMHPGRFAPAFGHGVESWMHQIGARPARRVAALREIVTVVRRLLAGETVTFGGDYVTLTDVTLDNAPEVVPPVLVGTTGPAGLALAGRDADGFLLPEGCGPAFVTEALQMATAGGSTPRCDVYAWLAIDDDATRARASLRPGIAAWRDSGLYAHPQRAAGVGPGDAVNDDVVDRLTIAGDGPACNAAVQRFGDAGADSVIVTPPGDDWREQIERFAHAVLR
jgi:alkanesulfonate monooxygenase SsuD/methylene tetrahydromethanopterin reductase-like flavin-dependent oxidoreductase (luciferase family)